jgi:quercetin dioxygenase-like cupin family protein
MNSISSDFLARVHTTSPLLKPATIQRFMSTPEQSHYSDDQIGLICQEPGDGARKHHHVTRDAWWVVLEGKFQWRLEDGTVITGKETGVIFLFKGTVHSIVCTSDRPGIRLACGAQKMEHIYVS